MMVSFYPGLEGNEVSLTFAEDFRLCDKLPAFGFGTPGDDGYCQQTKTLTVSYLFSHSE